MQRLPVGGPLRLPRPNPHRLLLVRAHVNRAGGKRVLRNGLQVVAGRRIDPRLVRRVSRILRIAIPRHLLRRRRPAVCVHRRQFHPAIGRDARLVRPVPRVHRIHVVENLPPRFRRGRTRAVPPPVPEPEEEDQADRAQPQSKLQGPHCLSSSSVTPVISSNRATAIAYIISCSCCRSSASIRVVTFVSTERKSVAPVSYDASDDSIVKSLCGTIVSAYSFISRHAVCAARYC